MSRCLLRSDTVGGGSPVRKKKSSTRIILSNQVLISWQRHLSGVVPFTSIIFKRQTSPIWLHQGRY